MDEMGHESDGFDGLTLIKKEKMGISDWIGFIGVSILLVAFFLNLANKLDKDSYAYIGMNIVGAGVACLASVMINYLPFIILEGSWTIVSLYALIKQIKNKSANPPRRTA